MRRRTDVAPAAVPPTAANAWATGRPPAPPGESRIAIRVPAVRVLAPPLTSYSGPVAWTASTAQFVAPALDQTTGPPVVPCVPAANTGAPTPGGLPVIFMLMNWSQLTWSEFSPVYSSEIVLPASPT